MTSVPDVRIRTPDQRLRVFVSSALEELADERAAVRRAVETLRLTPVMFELGARPYPPRALYRAYLEQSHVFLGIYWQSYGWVAPDEEMSGLEDEYRLSQQHPRLVYIRRPADERHERLDLLLRRIEADDQASYRQFATIDELERLVQDDLMVLLTERFEAGESAFDVVPHKASTEPPVPITPLVGRDREVTGIERLLEDGCRILTLLGSGGVGKSRLALDVCQPPNPVFPDGVAFVALEQVLDPSDVMRVLAESVGATIEGAQRPLEVAIRQLSGQRMLLLIDNFEQVQEAAPDVTALLEACPGVSIVVTSRRPLGVRGEHQFVVEPLAVPSTASSGGRLTSDDAADSPAVALFVDRAQRVRPAFALTDDNADAVVELVRRLDGLPLAIELAAARTKLLEPRQLLERFAGGVGVAMSAGHDVPARQRTLRATLEWSNALLTPAQQRLLARLSMFADSATLDAIEEVCAGAPVIDVVEDLSTLLDNGLLRADRQRDEGQPRFVMLMTVREFAAEQLASSGENAEVATRFIDWTIETTALGDPLVHSDAPARWSELRLDARNLRLAAELLLDAGDWKRFIRIAGGIFHWLYRFGDIQVFAGWAERALALCGDPATSDDPVAAARLCAVVSWTRFLVGDAVGAIAAQDVLDMDVVAASDPAYAALLLQQRALALPVMGNNDKARALAERSLVLADGANVDALRAYSHSFLANLDLIEGDISSSEQHSRECISIASGAGLRSLVCQQFAMLGIAEVAQGRLPDARRHLTAALEAGREEGSQLDAAVLLGHAAVLLAAEGNPAEAAHLRAVGDAAMARLGLAHWPMLEEARRISMQDTGPVMTDGTLTDIDHLDPWEELVRSLDRN